MSRMTVDYFWRNGEILPVSVATVPILSHGLSRGSGIFELFGIHKGAAGPMAFRGDDHLQRLNRSASLLGMVLPYSAQELFAALRELVAACHVNSRCLVKIVAFWSREEPVQLVLDEPLDMAMFLIPESEDLSLDQQHPLSACLSSWKKLSPDSVPIQAKACAHYLNGYLVKKEARDRGYDIGILSDAEGSLSEGATESVFMVNNGELLIPPADLVLDSISRRTVVSLANRLGIATREENLAVERLEYVDEIFISNSASIVVPINRYETFVLSAPGPVTTRLLQEVNMLLKNTEQYAPHWFTALR